MNSLCKYGIMMGLTILSTFYSFAVKAASGSNQSIQLVGCTPGDDEIKQLLAIPENVKVDFIRWNLLLTTTEANDQTYSLSIVYGESQPNTLGFIGGGQQKNFKGAFTIAAGKTRKNTQVYHLIARHQKNELLLEKLNENNFHLLSSKNQLMVGNGGWSYTLNRKTPLQYPSPLLPSYLAGAELLFDTTTQTIFEGRTPCLEFASEFNLSVAPDCFKLKWKLVLHRDPQTHLPQHYTLSRTNSRETNITGSWHIIKGLPANPNATLLQLDPDKPAKTISLLLGDSHVAYFLHKNNQLFTGNEDFSFTLNKRQNK